MKSEKQKKRVREQKKVKVYIKDLPKQREREDDLAFECNACGYSISRRLRVHSVDRDEPKTPSVAAVEAIQKGCPSCGEINRKLRGYLMHVDGADLRSKTKVGRRLNLVSSS
jgi:hypothetical protein